MIWPNDIKSVILKFVNCGSVKRRASIIEPVIFERVRNEYGNRWNDSWPDTMIGYASASTDQFMMDISVHKTYINHKVQFRRCLNDHEDKKFVPDCCCGGERTYLDGSPREVFTLAQ